MKNHKYLVKNNQYFKHLWRRAEGNGYKNVTQPRWRLLKKLINSKWYNEILEEKFENAIGFF